MWYEFFRGLFYLGVIIAAGLAGSGIAYLFYEYGFKIIKREIWKRLLDKIKK